MSTTMNVQENRVAMEVLGRTIPRKRVTVSHVLADGKIDNKEWVYYDSASSDSAAAAFPVLLCVPDTANTALAFFRQLTALSAHGIRVVAVTPAGYRTAEAFAGGLDLFVTSVLRKTGVHFFGVGLGAYLVQCYARTYSARLLSAVLCNGFLGTAHMPRTVFTHTAPMLPEFLLKRHFLAQLNADATDPLLVDLVELSTDMVESLSGAQLASHVALLAPPPEAAGNAPALPAALVTVLRSGNIQLYDDATEAEFDAAYADAKTAVLKDGGNMPEIAAAEEVNMHIQVHIRNHEQRIKDAAAAAASAADAEDAPAAL